MLFLAAFLYFKKANPQSLFRCDRLNCEVFNATSIHCILAMFCLLFQSSSPSHPSEMICAQCQVNWRQLFDWLVSFASNLLSASSFLSLLSIFSFPLSLSGSVSEFLSNSLTD